MTAWGIISTILANICVLLLSVASGMYIQERISILVKNRKKNKGCKNEEDRGN